MSAVVVGLGDATDLRAKKALRTGTGSTASFVCSVQAHRDGEPLQRHAIRRRRARAKVSKQSWQIVHPYKEWQPFQSDVMSDRPSANSAKT